MRATLAVSLVALLAAGAARMPAHAQDRPEVQASPSRPAGLPALEATLQGVLDARVAADRQPSLAMAIFDRSGLIWAGASGYGDAARTRPATPALVYRAGSTSKLFTDLMIMQEVEAGRLEIDAPIQRYLPDFHPRNPFGAPITTRQLMSHRSGLVREPPVGSYFDEGDASAFQKGPPGGAAVAASLNATTLVAKPGEIQKYSNAGVEVLGHLLEVLTGQTYADLVKTRILDRVGMPNTTFSVRGREASLAFAQMEPYGAPTQPAPVFDLGLQAAGGLATTVGDLARFGTAILNQTQGPGGRIVTAQTLAKMREIQFGTPGQEKGYGLGFAIERLDGVSRIGHGGAIYGYTTDFAVLPEIGVGVVVMGSMDGGEAPFDIGRYALSAMLALSRNAPPPPVPHPRGPLSAATAARLAGDYVAAGRHISVRTIEGRSWFEAPGSAGELLDQDGRPVLAADITAEGTPTFDAQGRWIELGGVRYVRAERTRPPPPDPRLARLIGVYVRGVNRIVVYERDGVPYAEIEGSYEPVAFDGPDRLVFSDKALLYRREALVFHRGKAGDVEALGIDGIRFARQDSRPGRFTSAQRAEQRRLVHLARIAADKARPPAEPGPFLPSKLVDLRKIAPDMDFDVRYATQNNFLGVPVYQKPIAYLQEPAAQAVARANRRLAAKGLGLVVHDAYRPWAVTKVFWDLTPDDKKIFVADPAQGSRHNRGAAIDAGVFDRRTGRELDAPSEYDEASARSYPTFVGGSDLQRWARDALYDAMEAEGLHAYAYEWWHFDFEGWKNFAIGTRNVDQEAAR